MYIIYSKGKTKRRKKRKSTTEGGEAEQDNSPDCDSVPINDRNWFCPSEHTLIAIGWQQFIEMKVGCVVVAR